MGILRYFLGVWLAVVLLISVLPLPAAAISPAETRMLESVEVQTKDFAGKDLQQAEFRQSRLEGANFSGADLRGAVFESATLIQANLHGVDFSDGIAYLTDFAGADLSDAILTSAMMLKSSFRGTKVTGADFSFAMLDRGQVSNLCQTASGVNPVTGVDTRESLGCP